MSPHGTALIRRGDLAASFGLLTRLPVRVDAAAAQARGAAAAWGWPVVGAVVGAVSAGAGVAAVAVGMPATIAAAVALATGAMLTGAMHEDGLADTCDGFWGGWTRERRLAIMKDSAIGTYGVLALVLVTLARWSAVAALLQGGSAWFQIIGVAALSRVPMVAIMAALPNARGEGLAHAVGTPRALTVALAAMLAFVIGAVALGVVVVPVASVMAGAGLAVALLARARIGGQTGDVLGAAQITTEVAGLAVIAAMQG